MGTFETQLKLQRVGAKGRFLTDDAPWLSANFHLQSSPEPFLEPMNRNTGIPRYETRDPFYATMAGKGKREPLNHDHCYY